jgi:predicted PurR-regulated permease PerM
VGFTFAVILAIWVLRPILLPFVVGIALAYLLNPVVNLVQRVVRGRGWATAIVLLAVVAVISGVVWLVTPLITTQIAGLVSLLPGYIGDLQEIVRGFAPQLIEWLGPERTAQLEASFSQFLGTGVEFIGSLTAQLAQSGLTVINTLAFIFLTPVIAFYLLLDWEGMVRGVDDLLPREHRREIRGVLDQIDRSMAGVVRGYGSVILVLCIYYATALTLSGLNFGLVIGLITGLFSFIPFMGFLTGFTLSMGIALVQFSPNWWMVAIIFLIYMVGQFMEGNILYPKLVGQSININPVWLMFALFAFAFLFGFVGLLLAVPLAAITATLTRYGIKRYKESALYHGERHHTRAQIEASVKADAAEAVVEDAVVEAAAAEAPVPTRRRKRLTPSK